jgi:predicted negative regulator of RcsB-dependent stress response
VGIKYMSTTTSELTSAAAAFERVIEGSPVIVVLLIAIGLVVWRTWRQDVQFLSAKAAAERAELLTELREERAARSEAHTQMVGVANRSTEAVHAVREALTELRHAIKAQH